MALQSDLTYKGVDIKGAYLKALATIDVAIYKDKEQRKKGSSLGNLKVDLSDNALKKIYEIIKVEIFKEYSDILDNNWKE